jgi:hypothetical protein
MSYTEKALFEISQHIDWDNYKNENNHYWKTSEVLYCKLDWLMQDEKLSVESIDTIILVQKLLEGIGADNYEFN